MLDLVPSLRKRVTKQNNLLSRHRGGRQEKLSTEREREREREREFEIPLRRDTPRSLPSSGQVRSSRLLALALTSMLLLKTDEDIKRLDINLIIELELFFFEERKKREREKES